MLLLLSLFLLLLLLSSSILSLLLSNLLFLFSDVFFSHQGWWKISDFLPNTRRAFEKRKGRRGGLDFDTLEHGETYQKRDCWNCHSYCLNITLIIYTYYFRCFFRYFLNIRLIIICHSWRFQGKTRWTHSEQQGWLKWYPNTPPNKLWNIFTGFKHFRKASSWSKLSTQLPLISFLQSLVSPQRS